jgi:hypothetical protein
MSGQPGLWQQLRQDSRDMNLSNRLGSIGRTWFVFPDGKGPRGSFTSMTTLLTGGLLRSRDVIVLGGVLREQCVAPLDIYDVTIIGAANRPRQSTSGGVPTGGGATWMAPASGAVASTPLLELRAQGWSINNISFTPHTSSAGIRLTRSASVDTIDAGHVEISDCLFAGQGGTGQIGIEDSGGSGFALIQNNRFEDLTGTAIKGLSTGAAVPQKWRVTRNVFTRNTNAIGMSSSKGLFDWNVFNQAADDTNFKVNLVAVSAQGDLNMVLHNVFSDAAANVTIAKGYKPGTTDVWRNWVTDTAAYIITVPA